MSTTKKLRLAIAGMGNMGKFHAAYLTRSTADRGNPVPEVLLTAACDPNADRRAAASEKYRITMFASHQEMLAAGVCDALLIATPHYGHVPMLLDAFQAGVHVLVEKPLAVSVTAARQAITAAAQHPRLKFGIMFNQRANPLYQKLRALIAAGELGTLTRLSWTVTNWFRPNAYYASSPWRATWRGEGGGVLINQCPHNLDLLHWLTGAQPSRVTAVGFVGKTHPIEVEDEISAIMEYPPRPAAPAMTGTFITSTGESPGTNRLEIAGTRGKIVAENGKLFLDQTQTPVDEFCRASAEPFGTPQLTHQEIAVESLAAAPGAAGAAGATPEHALVLQDFARAVLADFPQEKLLAPGADAIHSLELGNAMLLSALTRQPVNLPLDGPAFDDFLQGMIRNSSPRIQ